MAASSAQTTVGPLAPTSVVDVQVMYEGALPPPYFHRVTDGSGQGANLAHGTGKSVSLWFVQHSDKDLGLSPIVDLQILKSQECPEGFEVIKQELLRQDAESSKRYLGVKRRSADDEGLGVGNLTVTYGDENPAGDGWKELARINSTDNGTDVVIWGTDAEPVPEDEWSQQPLKEGDWVDVLDQSTWRLGRVVSCGDDGVLTIRMKGWSERYDKKLPQGSSQLARPASQSAGQNKRDIVSQGTAFDISWDDVKQMEMKLDDFMAGEFPESQKVSTPAARCHFAMQTCPAQDIFTKVELPYFVEKALTSDYGTADLHPRVNQFNQKVLEYCAWWMKRLDVDLPQEVSQQLLRLYLADRDCTFFFNVLSQGLRGDSPEAAEYNGPCGKLPPGGASRFFVKNMNHFHAAGGYDAMLCRLQRARPVPVSELNCYVKVLEIPKRCYEPEWVNTELQPLILAALKRSSHGADEDYNDFAEGQGAGVMYGLMKTLLSELAPVAAQAARVPVFSDGVTAVQLKEQWRAQVGVHVLSHTRLAVRLRGAEMLSTLCREALRASRILPMYAAGSYSRQRSTEYFDAASFAAYATEQHALERMLDLRVVPADSEAAAAATASGKQLMPACQEGFVAVPGSHGVHVQLIKSATDFAVLLVLCVNDLTREQVTLLVHAAEREGSAAAMAAVHELIVNAADIVPVAELQSLFERLASKPLEAWSESHVALLKNFTVEACKNIASKEQAQPAVGAPSVHIPHESAFALPVFWEVLTEGKAGALRSTILQAFVQLIAQHSLRGNALQYLQQCIQAVQERRNSVQHLEVASAIVEVLPHSAAAQEVTQSHVLSELGKEHDLVQLLVGELKEYKSVAVDAVAAAGRVPVCQVEQQQQTAATAVAAGQPVDGTAASSDKSAAGDDLLVDQTEHTTAIVTRLGFLQLVLASTGSKLSEDVIRQLFGAVPGSNATHAEKEKFMAWLRELQFGTVTHRPSAEDAALQPEVQEAVFTSLLCDAGSMRFVGLREEAFKTFEAFFQAVNTANGKLLKAAGGKFETVQAGMVGVDALWSIATQAQAPTVRASAMKLLVSLNVRAAASADISASFLQQAFVERCLSQLKAISSSTPSSSEPPAVAYSIATNTLRTLRAMLVTSTPTEEADPPTSLVRVTAEISSEVDPEAPPRTEELYFKTHATMYHVRETIAFKCECSPDCVGLEDATGVVDAALHEYNRLRDRVGDEGSIKAQLLQAPTNETVDHSCEFPAEDFSQAPPSQPDGTPASTEPLEDFVAQSTQRFQQLLNVGAWAAHAREESASPSVVRLGSALEQETWLLLKQLPLNNAVLVAVQTLEEDTEAVPRTWRDLCSDSKDMLQLLYTLELMQQFACDAAEVLAAPDAGEDEAKEADKPKGDAGFVDASGVNVDDEEEEVEEEQEEEAVNPWSLLTPASQQWSVKFLNAGGLQVLLNLLGEAMDVESAIVRGSLLAKRCLASLLMLSKHAAQLAAADNDAVQCEAVSADAAAHVTARILLIMKLTTEAGARRAEEQPSGEEEHVAAVGDVGGAGGASGTGVYDDNNGFMLMDAGFDDGLGMDEVTEFMRTGQFGGNSGITTSHNPMHAAARGGQGSAGNGVNAALGARITFTAAEVEADIIRHSVGVLSHLVAAGGASCTAVLRAVYAFQGVGDIFLQGVLSATEEAVRKEVLLGIVELCGPESTAAARTAEVQAPGDFFVPLLVDRLVQVYSHPDTCQQFFDLLSILISKAAAAAAGRKASLPIDAPALAAKLAQLIKLHPIVELTAKDEDPVLRGLLNVTAALARANPGMKQHMAMPAGEGGDGALGLLKEVFVECLFRVPSPDDAASASVGSGIPPKCKHASTRAAGFALLQELAKDTQPVSAALAMQVMEHRAADEAQDEGQSLGTSYESAPRSSAGYVGIFNPSCACYMISSIQQFFMIRAFREGVMGFKDTEDDKKESMMYQLQSLFAHLQESQRVAADIKPWCHAFKDWDGQPTSLTEQKDASEFLTQLFQNMEVRMQGTPQEKLLTEVFGGESVQELVSSTPEGELMYSRRSEPNMMLTVPVQGHKHLHEGLEALIAGETVDYTWEVPASGGGAVDKVRLETTKRMSISTPPAHLIVHLKRFEFDLNSMQQVKLDDFFEFPRELSLWDYTLYGRKDRDTPVTGAGGAVRTSPEDEAGDDAVDYTVPTSVQEGDFQYTLVGVVVHTGTAQGGHYYSYIRERSATGPTDRWLLFNDSNVTEWDDSELETATFGGEYERAASRYVGFGNTTHGAAYGGARGASSYRVSRSANGFLLFYDKVQPAPEAAAAASPSVSAPAGGDSGAQSDDAIIAAASSFAAKMRSRYQGASVAIENRVKVPDELYRTIWQDNLSFWRRNLTMNRTYIDFLASFVDQMTARSRAERGADGSAAVAYPSAGFVDDADAQEQTGGNLPVLRLLTRFVLHTLAKSHFKHELPKWIARIQRLIGADVRSCVWMLQSLLRTGTSAKDSQAAEAAGADMLDGSVDIPKCASAIKALLLESADHNVREAVADLLAYILRKLVVHEQLPAPADAPAARKAAWEAAAARAKDVGRPLQRSDFPAPPGLLVSAVLDAFMWLMPDMCMHGGSFRSFWRLLVMLVEEKDDAVRAPVAGYLLQRKMLGMTVDMLEQDNSCVKVLHHAAKARAQLLGGADLVTRAFDAGELDDGLEESKEPTPRYSMYAPISASSRKFRGSVYLHFTYRVLNGLIRCALPVSGEHGSPSQQAPAVQLTSPEVAMLQSTHWLATTLAGQMTTRRCANWLQHTFIQSAWGNSDVSKVLVDRGIELLKAAGHDKQGPSHRLFGALLKMDDSVAAERREYLLVRYWEALRERSNGYLETLFGLELAMRHAKRHAAVRRWMARSPSAWSWAAAWLAENKKQPVYTYGAAAGVSLSRFHTMYGSQFKMPRHPNLLANYRQLYRTAVDVAAEGGVALPNVDALTAGVESVESAEDKEVDVEEAADASVPDTELFDAGYDSEDEPESLVGKRIALLNQHSNTRRTGKVVDNEENMHLVHWDNLTEPVRENLSGQFVALEDTQLAPEVLQQQQEQGTQAARPPVPPGDDDVEDGEEVEGTAPPAGLPAAVVTERNPWGLGDVGHTTGAHGRLSGHTRYS